MKKAIDNLTIVALFGVLLVVWTLPTLVGVAATVILEAQELDGLASLAFLVGLGLNVLWLIWLYRQDDPQKVDGA